MAALQRQTDNLAKLWAMIDAHLDGRAMLEGDTFSLADLAIGTYARRWFGVEGVKKPTLPNLARWYENLGKRPGFMQIVAPPMS